MQNASLLPIDEPHLGHFNSTPSLVPQEVQNLSPTSTGAPHSVQKQPVDLSCLPLDELISPMTGFE